MIGVILLVLAALALLMRPSDIDGKQARELVENGALLLDVRTSAEFGGGHIPGAKNISVAELQNRISEVGDKDRTVVVYCRSGNRSARAKRMLEQAGFRDVKNLGAMSRW